MSEYPILFTDRMVRAILDGTKTQTRRLIKHQPEFGAYVSLTGFNRICLVHEDAWKNPVATQACPYAKHIGNRLWVKEKCSIGFTDDGDLAVDYRSDGKRIRYPITKQTLKYSAKYINDDWRRPSIFMPRWASRLSLPVTNIRAERLQSLSHEDAIAEGCTSIDEYHTLWNKINQDFTWEYNPWVWVITFPKYKSQEMDI